MPGTGLGLHIVQELIKVLRGEMEVENLPGGGGLRVLISLYRPENMGERLLTIVDEEDYLEQDSSET